MLQRLVRAAARGDDWGCCPAKPVRLVQRENVTGVHYKNSQTARENHAVRYGTVQEAPWRGGELPGRTPNTSTDPVTAAAGLNAGGSSGGTCWAVVYAVVASSIVVAALIIAVVAIFVRRRRRRLHNSAGGSNGGGGGQYNKKLAGILTPSHRNLLLQQPKSAATPTPGFDDAKSPPNAASSVISSSSKRPSTGGNPRHGYTPLPGGVYSSAKAGGATQLRDPNPYGLPPSQCSYQPQRVKFVTLKRKRTIDSQTGDVDAGGDHDDEEERSPSREFAEVDNDGPALNDLQALLPLTSLKSLFGVVSGVFGVAPSFGGGAKQPVSTIDRRASCIAVQRSAPGVDGPTASHVIGEPNKGVKAALVRRDSNFSTRPADVGGREMGASASAEPPPSGSGDLMGTTPPVQSSPNDFESCGSSGALDNVQASDVTIRGNNLIKLELELEFFSYN